MRERIARSALRWEAGYCLVMGVAMAVWFRPVAGVLGAPRPLVAIGGVAIAGWGGLLARSSVATAWRLGTALVTLANLSATVLIVAITLLVDLGTAGKVVLGGAALHILGFAAVQTHALWSPFVR